MQPHAHTEGKGGERGEEHFQMLYEIHIYLSLSPRVCPFHIRFIHFSSFGYYLFLLIRWVGERHDPRFMHHSF